MDTALTCRRLISSSTIAPLRRVKPDREEISMRGRPRRDIQERLWAKVDKRTPADCWLWLGACRAGGQPCIRNNGVLVMARRVIHEPIPAGYTVVSTCGNKRCMNPAHHAVVPQQDAATVGRGEHKAPATAKLAPEDVRVIRALVAGGERQVDVALKYGVHPSTVKRIVHNIIWRAVKPAREEIKEKCQQED